MNVLQHPEPVIRRRQAEIIAILLVPYLRQLADRQSFIKQHLLDLITDDDMQIISQFIRFDPDERVLHAIDPEKERLRCNVFELFREMLL
ncbi:hypothetical protein D3C74_290700 [compost metagenome]